MAALENLPPGDLPLSKTGTRGPRGDAQLRSLDPADKGPGVGSSLRCCREQQTFSELVLYCFYLFYLLFKNSSPT